MNKPKEPKEHKFIVFLLGLVVGKYGIPAVMHMFYITVIVILTTMGHYWGQGG